MRLFIAADLDDETRRQLAAAREAMRTVLERARVPPRVRWVDEAQAHVTLRFIGQVAEDRVPAVQHALEAPLAVSPFDVRWDRLGTFGGRRPRVVWVGAVRDEDAMAALARAVSDRVEPLVGPGESRPFRAHITLGRVKDPGRQVDWPAALAAPDWAPTTTHVDHVTLYASRVSSQGATYTALSRTAMR